MHLYARDKKHASEMKGKVLGLIFIWAYGPSQTGDGQNSGLCPKNGPQIYSEKVTGSNNDKCKL